VSVKEILEAIQALSPEERVQVRALLATLPDAPLSLEEEALVWLRAAGLLGETTLRSDSPHAGRDKRQAAFTDYRR
jgi:hypothetical protein